MKRYVIVYATFALSILFGSSIQPIAYAADTYTEATESTWGVITNDDGFVKTITIYKEGDNTGSDDFGDDITYTTEIQCTKKKLTFMVYSEPIGIYPTTSFTSIDGYALTKVDSVASV